jgi:hypothetical protein
MKPLRQKAAVLALCAALAALCGCQHKKPVLVMPQQPPPTAAPSPSPTPEPAATAQPAEQQQEPSQQAQTASPEQAKPEPQTEKTRHGKKPSPRKPAQPATGGNTEVARNTPGRKVIPADKAEPTPTPGQISPGGGTQDQAATEQLLQNAESNLNGIKRQLSKEEEAKRTQVKEFISQSRKAITENDSTRAHTLAVKARTLSEELVKQP